MKRLFALMTLVAIALTGCAATGMRSQSAAPTEAPAAPAFGAPSLEGGANDFGSDKAVGAPPAATAVAALPQETDRLVIQNAELSIVVADVNARVDAIQSMTRAMGGFVVSVNVYDTAAYDSEPVPQASMVVRVPQERMDEALAQVKQGAVDVRSETRSGTDVTDQYVDLQSRLKAKQAAEQQLLSIMQEAKRTEDVLAVYAQLQQIQSDIEVLKGQIKYYQQSAAMSAISLTIIAEQTVKPLEVAGWKPQGVARDAIQRLIYFWQGFVNFLIRLILFILPVLITIGIPLVLVFLFLRWLIRRMRRPRTPATPAPGK